MAIIFPGGPEVGDTYEAPNGIIYQYSDGAWRLSAENQGTIGVHMDTSPPANPQNGDLWFHTGEADLKIFYVDPDSSQWIPASSPPDPYEENFVSISGDTMTGMLKFSEINDDSGLRFLKDDGSTLSSLYRSSDGLTRANLLYGSKFALYCKSEDNSGTATMLTAQWKAGESEAKLYLYHVADPTNDVHAANKKYVDDAVKNSANRTWKWKAGGGTPGPGQWTNYQEEYIRIHHTTHNGMDLDYSSGFNEDLNTGTTAIAKLAFTGWRISNGKAQPKYFIWVGWFNDTSDYFELKGLSSTDKTDLGLQDGYEYELHLAGFF